VAVPANTGNFEIKPGVVQLMPKFRGLDSENPYMHLKEFDMVCAMHLSKFDDVVKLLLFPFSLIEKAKSCEVEDVEERMYKDSDKLSMFHLSVSDFIYPNLSPWVRFRLG
jgi:hypothetical protein